MEHRRLIGRENSRGKPCGEVGDHADDRGRYRIEDHAGARTVRQTLDEGRAGQNEEEARDEGRP